ncbi:hypothetical protein LCL89_04685 [Halobacillus yeomjeoni]|uniref:hypothetical protein n=1 Tax=Halobacillus yeomjeoni TaxID=311194 RepID=UPI001CD66276|nr:hypothetical protein [Halobacillus yeomjeoni]MCA0983345.1 hypothetical protein [Halobacillus yeomjeoni]
MKNIISSLGKLLESNVVSNQPKRGHVLSGKVQQLYPDNRATVQIGKQQVNAQLETPLTKGRTYLFKVVSNEEMLHLKVLSSQQSKAPVSAGLSDLLRQSGGKVSKTNLQFLRQLIDQQASFKVADLKEALSILQGAWNKTAAKEVLLQMFQKQLPVKAAVFDALHSRLNSTWSSSMETASTQQLDMKTSTLLAQLKGERPSHSLMDTSVTKIMSEVRTGNPSTYQLFKQAGLIESSHSFKEFQNSWKEWSVQSKETHPPLPGAFKGIAGSMQKLFHDQLPFTNTERQTWNQWVNQLERIISTPAGQRKALPDTFQQGLLKNFEKLQNTAVLQKLLPFLTEADASTLKSITNNPEVLFQDRSSSLQQLVQSLKHLASRQIDVNLQPSLVEWVSRLSGEYPDLTQKNAMLMKIKSMIHLSGMQDESLLKSALQSDSPMAKETSLKSILLQSLEGQGPMRADTARPLLHFLNGTQLNALQETQQTLQATLQFPGSFVGSSEDVHMNMEGRKTPKGEIDPDFCHILFYLNLEHLNETIVDLSISDRRVGVTVMNKDQSIEAVVHSFKNKLAEGLEALGYELNSLNVRTLKPEPGPVSPQEHKESSKEGVDLRI